MKNIRIFDFVGAGHAGARTKVFRTRDCFFVRGHGPLLQFLRVLRGQHPQGVRRGCKGLKPQQHTQGPLLHTRESFTDGLIPLLDCFWQIA